jgi:hypothetical protein
VLLTSLTGSDEKSPILGLVNLLRLLLDISPVELQDTIRISCLCTARAVSSRLGPHNPLTLKRWAAYFREWDTEGLDRGSLMRSFEIALSDSEAEHGPDSEYTIDLLCNYTIAAHYVCGDNELAGRLAADLWERTRCANERGLATWTLKAWAGVEAAQVLALTSCIKTDFMRKNTADRIAARKRGMANGDTRRRWHETVYRAPDRDMALRGLAPLKETVQQLGQGDWDCQLVTASVTDKLARLVQDFEEEAAGRHSETARRLREQGLELRRGIVMWQEFITEEPMDPCQVGV